MRKKLATLLFPIFLVFSIFRESAEPAGAKPDTPIISILASSAQQLVLQITLPELFLESVEMLDGNIYTMAWAEGFGQGLIGAPDVPVLSTWILVPNGTTPDVSVELAGEQVIGEVYLRPVQSLRADLEEAPYPAFEIDEDIYNTDSDYPGVQVELSEVQVQRGQQVALLNIYPYHHNPIQRTLKIFPDMIVTVDFAGDLQPIDHELKSKSFEDYFKSVAINADDVLAAQEEVEPPYYEPALYPYGWDYIIITHKDFLQAANKLAAWKKKSGFKTLVFSLPTNWKAKDIFEALSGAYKSWDVKPEYVLFLGDAEFVPTNYEWWHPFNNNLAEKNSQGYVGTDLYYSTLKHFNWSSPGDHMKPQIWSGRLSVETANQALQRVDGIINYEKDPNMEDTFYDDVVLVAGFEDGKPYQYEENGVIKTDTRPKDGREDRRFTQTVEDLAIFFTSSTINKTVRRDFNAFSNVSPTHWNDNKQYPQEFVNFDGPMVGGSKTSLVGGSIPSSLLKSNGFPWDADYADITTDIQNGSFLVVYRGHGGRRHWAQPYYSWSDAYLIQNLSRLPVVWSINCQTGWFDNETDFSKKPTNVSNLVDKTANWEETFSEYWERPAWGDYGDYGAVGLVAPTRVSYSGLNEYFTLYMAEAIWPDFALIPGVPLYEMAQVMNYGLDKMDLKFPKINNIVNSLVIATHEDYHWFGDPSMKIRTEKPKLMVAAAEPYWPWLLRKNTLAINVTELSDRGETLKPVEDAKIAISFEDDDSQLWVAYTDSEGQAIIPDLQVRHPGFYDLVVTAPNFLPFQSQIESAAGQSGGVVFDAGAYACDSDIGISLADIDLEGQQGQPVIIETANGDLEMVSLHQDDPGTGFFQGGIAASSDALIQEDGVLQVVDGETITVRYHDRDDGSGSSAWVTDTALIDCQPPVFDGLASAVVSGCEITLDWQLAFDPLGVVFYNIYRIVGVEEGVGERIATTWSNTFTDYDCFPNQTVSYFVRAMDRLGNEDANMLSISAFVNGLFLPLIVAP